MSAHTPGPWQIDGDQITTADAGIPICDLHMEDELEWGGPDLIAEAEANARLISAAPCLLEALREMRKEYGDYADTANTLEAVRLADAALSKAEGRS